MLSGVVVRAPPTSTKPLALRKRRSSAIPLALETITTTLTVAALVPHLPVSSSHDSDVHCDGRKFCEKQLTGCGSNRRPANPVLHSNGAGSRKTREAWLNRPRFLGDLIFLGGRGSMGRPSRFSPEVRERAIRLVVEQRPAYPSAWAALRASEPANVSNGGYGDRHHRPKAIRRRLKTSKNPHVQAFC